MSTMANVTRTDIDHAIKKLQEMRESLPGESGPVEIPTGECPQAQAVRAHVGSIFSRLGAFLTSNREPRQ